MCPILNPSTRYPPPADGEPHKRVIPLDQVRIQRPDPTQPPPPCQSLASRWSGLLSCRHVTLFAAVWSEPCELAADKTVNIYPDARWEHLRLETQRPCKTHASAYCCASTSTFSCVMKCHANASDLEMLQPMQKQGFVILFILLRT